MPTENRDTTRTFTTIHFLSRNDKTWRLICDAVALASGELQITVTVRGNDDATSQVDCGETYFRSVER